MSLDQAQEQRVRAWLQAKQVADDCPACHARDWVILEIVDAPRPLAGRTAYGGAGLAPDSPWLSQLRLRDVLCRGETGAGRAPRCSCA